MKDKKYRIYNIILTNLVSEEADSKFANIIKDNNFEWWRYTPLTWILITPINVSTNQIIKYVLDSYGTSTFSCVLEIDINDFGGVMPQFITKDSPQSVKATTPFTFFQKIASSDFTPKWEKEKE